MNNAIAQLARSSNEFGFDLYQRLRWEPGNFVISPSSITTALTMTWGGAKGEAEAQLRRVLHLEGPANEVMNTSGELARSLQEPSRPIVLRIANQLFSEKTYPLVPAFVEKTRQVFGAPVEPLDFIGRPEQARIHINQWVEDKTEHRIKDLIPPAAIDPDTRLVLVNAIYFLGNWADPFIAERTRPAPFHLTASETKDVPTMNRTGRFRIAHAAGIAALEIPYKGGQLSMTLLVPDEIDGLAAVESTLDAKKLDALTSALQEKSASVSLPRFEVNPAESMSLGTDLAALGMPAAFDSKRADFTGLANPPDPNDRVFISHVFHKGFVRVDEKGTEAAAATAVLMALGLTSDEYQLKVDRPFLFLIRDNSSGLVLFLGRVTDPSRL